MIVNKTEAALPACRFGSQVGACVLHSLGAR